VASNHLMVLDERIFAILLHELGQAGLHVARAREASHRLLKLFLPILEILSPTCGLDHSWAESLRVFLKVF